MTPSEVEQAIRARVSASVTPQRLVFAKGIIFEKAKSKHTSGELLKAVLDANGVVKPESIVLHSAVDLGPLLNAAVEHLAWELAGAEALLSLVHSGVLIAIGDPHSIAPSINWTTIYAGSGGTSAGWIFEEFAVPVPSSVRRAPSTYGMQNQYLSDADLFLGELAIPGMHTDVTSSIRESIKCFRAELFTASLAMLGKASEGAWLELGAALLRIVPPVVEPSISKQRAILEDSMSGPLRKVEAVLTVYRNDLFASVIKGSGVRNKELGPVAVWSDAVRDSRNTIHFGVQPSTANTYEKVAALLVGSVPNMRTLYRVKEVADSVPYSE